MYSSLLLPFPAIAHRDRHHWHGKSRASNREAARETPRFRSPPGRTGCTQDATVASRYTRENLSKIYFGFNYDPNDHLYLSEIDPLLREHLMSHRYWMSVARTYPSRQLSSELPVDQGTFERVDHGMGVAFSYRIAALIRGKSVYCVPIDFTIDS